MTSYLPSSEKTSKAVRSAQATGKKSIQKVLDGQKRLRDSSERELKAAVKEARRQISVLAESAEDLQQRLDHRETALEYLRGTVAELKARLEQSEKQVDELRNELAGKIAVKKPAVKKPAAKKPAAKK